MSQELPEPVAPIVEVLQEHLDDALAGDVQAVAIVTLDGAGEIFTVYRLANEAQMGDLYLGVGLLTDRLRRVVLRGSAEE